MSICQLCGEYSVNLAYPVYCDPKIDGVRCLIIVVNGQARAVTRTGTPIPQAQRIADQFGGMAVDVVFDGELLGASWSDTVRIINTPGHDGSGLTLYVFDALPYDDWRAGACKWWLAERQTILTAAHGCVGVVVVEGQLCYNEQAIDDYYRACLEAGHEGIVIKNPRAGYVCRRSVNWRKRKPVITLDVPIVGVYDRGIVVRLPSGDTVRVGSGFSVVELADVWARRDELVGTFAEIAMKVGEGSEWATFKRLRGDK